MASFFTDFLYLTDTLLLIIFEPVSDILIKFLKIVVINSGMVGNRRFSLKMLAAIFLILKIFVGNFTAKIYIRGKLTN